MNVYGNTLAEEKKNNWQKPNRKVPFSVVERLIGLVICGSVASDGHLQETRCVAGAECCRQWYCKGVAALGGGTTSVALGGLCQSPWGRTTSVALGELRQRP